MDPTARAFDALQIYLNATPDRPWPHVEQMALDRLRARVVELEAIEQRAQYCTTWTQHQPGRDVARYILGEA